MADNETTGAREKKKRGLIMRDFIIGVLAWLYTHAWWIALTVSGLMLIKFAIIYFTTSSIIIPIIIIISSTVFVISICQIIDKQFLD